VSVVHVVVPDGVDDPARPSGGNTYDRRVCEELRGLGWSVHEHAVPGFWRRPTAASFESLAGALTRIPAGAVVLIDGLIGSAAPEVLVSHAQRLRFVVLVHMPLGHRPAAADDVPRERAALTLAAAVVTTSAWARTRLIELYALAGDHVHVAQPGADAAKLAAGTESGGSLLCVANVIYEKGHDVLLAALQAISDLSWRCVCVGRLDREPEFAADLRHDPRVSFAGPQTGAGLDRCYSNADVLVLPSRAETYGMVVTEALARGLPVIASDLGGVREAFGQGTEPGLLVAPEDPSALASALRAWLCDPELRACLRQAARERRESLRPWSSTASALAATLTEALR
jgi:glycosyltransferase involved in cell wall biosynthesis